MTFFIDKSEVIQKKVQRVLEEKGVWLVGRLNLSCPKPKYFNC